MSGWSGKVTDTGAKVVLRVPGGSGQVHCSGQRSLGGKPLPMLGNQSWRKCAPQLSCTCFILNCSTKHGTALPRKHINSLPCIHVMLFISPACNRALNYQSDSVLHYFATSLWTIAYGKLIKIWSIHQKNRRLMIICSILISYCFSWRPS